MCEICDIQQLIDCLKQEKETNDEVIYGIVDFLKYKGDEYIKRFFIIFVQEDPTVQGGDELDLIIFLLQRYNYFRRKSNFFCKKT